MKVEIKPLNYTVWSVPCKPEQSKQENLGNIYSELSSLQRAHVFLSMLTEIGGLIFFSVRAVHFCHFNFQIFGI